MNSQEEKAKELVEKFIKAMNETLDVSYPYSSVENVDLAAKRSSLICVDEIIAALNEVVDDYMHVDAVPGSIGGANYYQQVKEAIQKL